MRILQFNQMRGVQEGKKEVKNGELILSGQKAERLPGRYLLVEVDSATGKIVEFKKAALYDMRSTAVLEEETETKVQKWSLEHKKNMVSQFGTSKSKRKLNQMMSNII